MLLSFSWLRRRANLEFETLSRTYSVLYAWFVLDLGSASGASLIKRSLGCVVTRE